MNEKLTQMNIAQNTDHIIIHFPEVQKLLERDTLPGHLDFLKGQVEQHNNKKYFSFQSEHTLQEEIPKTVLNIAFNGEYENSHPEKVALLAFNEHRNFVLSPEHIGAQLMLDFGEYVTNNQKKCAPIFNGKVDKKKELVVELDLDESLKTFDVLARTIAEWENAVLKETDAIIRNDLHPKFSSNNPITDIVYGGLLLGAAKDFYEFNIASFCGIPKIKVEGTKEDWNKVAKMAKNLSLVKELNEIAPYYEWLNNVVLENILGLYNGQENMLFWSSLIKDKSDSGEEGYTAGWLPDINLYNEKGKLLNLENRWTEKKTEIGNRHFTVPVVEILVRSDKSPIQTIDPNLMLKIGFTSTTYNGLEGDEFLRTSLGIDAYVQEQQKKSFGLRKLINTASDLANYLKKI